MQNNANPGGIIRIISTPAGQAPLDIREKWIGIEMPFLRIDTPCAHGAVDFKKVEPGEGFIVDQTIALAALRKTCPDAANWWRTAGYPMRESKFIFVRGCAEIIG